MRLNNCARTYDKEYIKAVLTHPTIWPNISDGVEINPKDYEPPMDEDNIYLKVDGGLFILHPFADGHKFHANMIERGDRATEATKDAFAWAKAQGIKTLYAEIHERFKNVIAYAKRSGFKEFSVVNKKHFFIKRLEQ